LLNRSKNPLEGISPEYSDYLKNWLYEILYNDALICQNPILPQTISYQEIIHGDYSVYKQALANRESPISILGSMRSIANLSLFSHKPPVTSYR
jgi:hypothetical protein